MTTQLINYYTRSMEREEMRLQRISIKRKAKRSNKRKFNREQRR